MIAQSGGFDIRLGAWPNFLFLDQRALASGILLKGGSAGSWKQF